MTFTVDWINKIVDSDIGITDIPAAHTALRVLEASNTGVLYPSILTYKLVDLGNGASFPAITFQNGYQLRFPNAGSYTISGGNFRAAIVPVAGVYVERNSAAAYAVTAVGGTAVLTPAQDAMLTALAKIHGLVTGTPLVVTDTSRVAGDITQTVIDNGTSTIVTRV